MNSTTPDRHLSSSDLKAMIGYQHIHPGDGRRGDIFYS